MAVSGATHAGVARHAIGGVRAAVQCRSGGIAAAACCRKGVNVLALFARGVGGESQLFKKEKISLAGRDASGWSVALRCPSTLVSTLEDEYKSAIYREPVLGVVGALFTSYSGKGTAEDAAYKNTLESATGVVVQEPGTDIVTEAQQHLFRIARLRCTGLGADLGPAYSLSAGRHGIGVVAGSSTHIRRRNVRVFVAGGQIPNFIRNYINKIDIPPSVKEEVLDCIQMAVELGEKELLKDLLRSKDELLKAQDQLKTVELEQKDMQKDMEHSTRIFALELIQTKCQFEVHAIPELVFALFPRKYRNWRYIMTLTPKLYTQILQVTPWYDASLTDQEQLEYVANQLHIGYSELCHHHHQGVVQDKVFMIPGVVSPSLALAYKCMAEMYLNLECDVYEEYANFLYNLVKKN